MRIKLFFIFTTIAASVLSGQAFQTFQIGIGNGSDSYTFSGFNPIFINDSIFFVDEESIFNPFGRINNSRINKIMYGKHSNRQPEFTIYIESQILKKEKANISLALYWSRQWPQLALGRISDQPDRFPIYYRPSSNRTELFFPVSANVKPFSKIQLLKRITFGIGIGPSIYLWNLAARIDYDLGLRNKRKDSVYYEAHYQFAKNAFKTLTFNYNWSMQLELTKRINFRVTGRGSTGSVTKPFNVFGERHKVPLRRRGLVYLLTYSFNLPNSAGSSLPASE
ncbi:MAG: hypothetical protein OXH57_04735 [Ekhidna sp.]|nr:hypothetical protein [Ekhidna sp.]